MCEEEIVIKVGSRIRTTLKVYCYGIGLMQRVIKCKIMNLNLPSKTYHNELDLILPLKSKHF